MLLQKKLPIKERIFKGEKVHLLVLGRDEIKNFSYDKPYLVISITDSANDKAEMLQSPKLVEVLKLKFDDIEKPRKFQEVNPSDVLMNKNQAKQILSFVNKYLGKVDLIVCQCEQGVSRSAGIAGALSRILQNEDKYFLKNYWANRWVYDLLIKSAKEDLGLQVES